MTSNIEWVAGDDGRKGKTWNPVRGCWPVSPGCLNCYATRQAIRATAPGKAYAGLVESHLITIGGKEKRVPRWTGEVSFDADALADPLSWREPARVFVNSMSDLFHDGFTDDQIGAVFGAMALAKQHSFIVLTKRAERMQHWVSTLSEAKALRPSHWCVDRYLEQLKPTSQQRTKMGLIPDVWPLPNVMLGVSVENQKCADERVPRLLRTPAAVRLLSMEPLLEAVELKPEWLAPFHDVTAALKPTPRIGWVIAGGESGPGARPFNLTWARELRDACAAAGVPFFLKQIGSRPFVKREASFATERQLVGGGHLSIKASSMTLESTVAISDKKGGVAADWPVDLRVRQWPKGGVA